MLRTQDGTPDWVIRPGRIVNYCVRADDDQLTMHGAVRGDLVTARVVSTIDAQVTALWCYVDGVFDEVPIRPREHGTRPGDWRWPSEGTGVLMDLGAA